MTFKNFLSFPVLLLATINLNGQSSCCKAISEPGKSLAMTSAFQAAHLAPLPLVYQADRGKTITYPVAGGADATAFYAPSSTPTSKVLIVFHEWWGLNDYIKKEAESWQSELGAVDVYAIDLYEGKVASTPEEAGKLMSGLDQMRAKAVVEGLLKKIGTDKTIATLGWCMGGSWSFQAALSGGESVKACVMYYGFPEEDKQKIKALRTDVLYICAMQDDFITRLSIDKFAEAIESYGRKINIQSYDAVHAFANPSNPKYDEAKSTLARKSAIEFIRTKLKL